MVGGRAAPAKRRKAGVGTGPARIRWRLVSEMAVEPAPYAFTVEEFHRMGASGIFAEDDRVELVDGAVVEMTPVGSRHAACVDRLARALFEGVGPRAIVRVQSPVRLGRRSEPHPDLALLRPRADFYAEAHPGPGDLLLVVEVAETSARFDREVKVPLYARAGVPEVWLVDLAAGEIEALREPARGRYAESSRAGREDAMSPRAFPDVGIPAGPLLGHQGG